MLARNISRSNGASAGKNGRSASLGCATRHHRAISQVVPSLESFSTMPMAASSSRMRSDSLKFFACARGCPSLNQTFDLALVDRKATQAGRPPIWPQAIAASRSVAHRLQRGRRRLDAFRSFATQIVHRGDGLRCIEIIQQRIKRVGAQIAGLHVSGQVVQVIELLLRFTQSQRPSN